jgi:hypothetical protein
VERRFHGPRRFYKPGRPDGGISLAARELGIEESEPAAL